MLDSFRVYIWWNNLLYNRKHYFKGMVNILNYNTVVSSKFRYHYVCLNALWKQRPFLRIDWFSSYYIEAESTQVKKEKNSSIGLNSITVGSENTWWLVLNSTARAAHVPQGLLLIAVFLQITYWKLLGLMMFSRKLDLRTRMADNKPLQWKV